MAEREGEQIRRQYKRRDKASVVPGLTVEQPKPGNIVIGNEHKEPAKGQALIMEAMGTADVSFYEGMLDQVVSFALADGQVNTRTSNFMLSAIAGIKPRDEVESMLAAQMAVVHFNTMTMARRLKNAENIPQQDSAERAFNKLARTFAAQVEALKRYRSKGEQRVYVERVNVGEGGQAIVGNVIKGEG